MHLQPGARADRLGVGAIGADALVTSGDEEVCDPRRSERPTVALKDEAPSLLALHA